VPRVPPALSLAYFTLSKYDPAEAWRVAATILGPDARSDRRRQLALPPSRGVETDDLGGGAASSTGSNDDLVADLLMRQFVGSGHTVVIDTKSHEAVVDVLEDANPVPGTSGSFAAGVDNPHAAVVATSEASLAAARSRV